MVQITPLEFSSFKRIGFKEEGNLAPEATQTKCILSSVAFT